MFRDRIRSLLAEISATWLKRRQAPATSHKGKVAANDTKTKRPHTQRAHEPRPPVKPASKM